MGSPALDYSARDSELLLSSTSPFDGQERETEVVGETRASDVALDEDLHAREKKVSYIW
jgi:hypothetical protein